MAEIVFDSGVREYRLNGMGTLRFHPGDPNLYARFFDALDEIQELIGELNQKTAGDAQEYSGRDTVTLMAQMDSNVKKILNRAFGLDNDFDRILGGLNLMAVAGNGKPIITNLLDALEPVLAEGAKECAAQQVRAAKAKQEQRHP